MIIDAHNHVLAAGLYPGYERFIKEMTIGYFQSRGELPYEREGFFGGVVFTCGLVREHDDVRIYYGAADGVTAVADISLDEIMGGLE